MIGKLQIDPVKLQNYLLETFEVSLKGPKTIQSFISSKKIADAINDHLTYLSGLGAVPGYVTSTNRYPLGAGYFEWLQVFFNFDPFAKKISVNTSGYTSKSVSSAQLSAVMDALNAM